MSDTRQDARGTLTELHPDLTVAILKPDAVRRGLIGHILDRAARDRALIPVDMRMDTMTPELGRRFYDEHRGASYFEELLDFMNRGPSVYVLFRSASGANARVIWRSILGATNPAEAELGTLRRLYGTHGPANIGHGSDSAEAVEREMGLLELRVR